MNRKGSRIAEDIDRDYKAKLRNKDKFRKLCNMKICPICNYKSMCDDAKVSK